MFTAEDPSLSSSLIFCASTWPSSDDKVSKELSVCKRSCSETLPITLPSVDKDLRTTLDSVRTFAAWLNSSREVQVKDLSSISLLSKAMLTALISSKLPHRTKPSGISLHSTFPSRCTTWRMVCICVKLFPCVLGSRRPKTLLNTSKYKWDRISAYSGYWPIY